MLNTGEAPTAEGQRRNQRDDHHLSICLHAISFDRAEADRCGGLLNTGEAPTGGTEETALSNPPCTPSLWLGHLFGWAISLVGPSLWPCLR